MEHCTLTTHSEVENGLLLAGVPFHRGVLRPETPLALQADARPLPCWHTLRSLWPDGSVRWVWLHGRVPHGEAALRLVSGEPMKSGEPPSSPQDHNGFLFRSGGQELSVRDHGVLSFSGLHVCEVPVVTDLCKMLPGEIESAGIVEESPIAPLVRVLSRANPLWRVEYLVRMDSALSVLALTRRITFLGAKKLQLRSMGIQIVSPSRQWPPFTYSAPPGRTEALLEGPHAAVYVPKGWQRAPLRMAANGEQATISLYPAKAPSLTVWPGTSFRHTVRIAFGGNAASRARNEVRWALDPEYTCSTGVFGHLMPRNEAVKRWFPMYDAALQSGSSGARKRTMDSVMDGPMGEPASLEDEEHQAPEYFGLIHYGDWPLELGRYAKPSLDHRVYADNEYDIPFVFFQQFARTGEWRYVDAAREGATHTADVDFDAVRGGMRYHGYDRNGEDHAEHRVPGGNMDHTWTDSLWAQHFLFGDPWAREAACKLGGYMMTELAGDTDEAMLRQWLGQERRLAWPLSLLTAQVEATGDAAALSKCRQIVDYLDRFYADPDSFIETQAVCRNAGNWVTHEVGKGVAYEEGDSVRWMCCSTREGTAGFMIGLSLEALARYHALTGDPDAVRTMDRMCRFLVEELWRPLAGRFDYTYNPHLREARVLDEAGGMMGVWGLAYAHEQTGNPVYRQVAAHAFYGYLCTMVNPRAARDLAEVARAAGGVVCLMDKWRREDDRRQAAEIAPTVGQPFEFHGAPQDLLELPRCRLERGEPCFTPEGGLESYGPTFMALSLDPPAPTARGDIALNVIPWWDGNTPNSLAQRCYVHLCGDAYTASAVSIVSYYDRMSVRFYDAKRRLIDSLDTVISHWKPDEMHRIEVRWSESGASLALDGAEVHRITLSRRIGGSFRKLSVGYRTGNWKADGVIESVSIKTD